MASGDLPSQEIAIPWTAQQKDARPTIEGNGSPKYARNESLIQSVVRAYAWGALGLHDASRASFSKPQNFCSTSKSS
jgi:hypothetical protein